MVQKVTIFEPHFDGASFGPTFGESETTDEAVDEEAVVEAEAESGGFPLGRVVLMLGVSAVATVVARRLARRFGGEASEDEDIDIAGFEESEAPMTQ
ncbi:MAG: hypothetical protein ABEJ89_00885 [Haloarculaceae archaeon]